MTRGHSATAGAVVLAMLAFSVTDAAAGSLERKPRHSVVQVRDHGATSFHFSFGTTRHRGFRAFEPRGFRHHRGFHRFRAHRFGHRGFRHRGFKQHRFKRHRFRHHRFKHHRFGHRRARHFRHRW